MREKFVLTVSELAANDPNLMLLTADLGFGVLNGFALKYPSQYCNVGIAEQNLTGIGAGLSIMGKHVFTYSIGNFNTLRCLEQIRNDLCYNESSVTIVSVGAGFSYGPLGFSHHATEDIAVMRALPNLRIFSPSTLGEVVCLTKFIYETKGVCYLRLDKSFVDDTQFGISPDLSKDELSQGFRYLREGGKTLVVSYSGITEVVLNAVNDICQKKQIDIAVISFFMIKGFDEDKVIEILKKYDNLIIIEEHSSIGGVTDILSAISLKNKLLFSKFHSISIGDKFNKIVGTQDYLRKCLGLDYKSIYSLIDSFSE